MDQKQNDTYLAGVRRKEEERRFIRYTGDSECELKIGSETYKGSVIDFSDGLGVIIEKIPELEKGTRAHVKIYDYEIEFGAEIAWVKESEDHLRIGFRRLDRFEGNLKHYRLPDVLSGINRSEKTGVLEITSGSTVKQIYVKDGDKIFATSNNEDDRLGEYLLKHGRITVEEFDQASYLVTKKGERLGKSLIDLGYLAPTELFQSVQQQIEEIILSLFSLEEGRFEFKERTLSSVEAITLQTTTANLIYKGIKEIKNFVHVKSMCPTVDTVLNLSQIPVNIFKSLTLEDADKKTLSYVNGVHPLKTILSLSPSTNFDTLKTISALLSIGFIHKKGEDEAPEKLPIERVFSESCEETAEESTEEMPEAETVMKEAGDEEWGPYEEPETVELGGEAEAEDEEPVDAESNEVNEKNIFAQESDEIEAEAVMEEARVEKRLEIPDPVEHPGELAAAANAEDFFQSYDSTIEEVPEDAGRFEDNDEMKASHLTESAEAEDGESVQVYDRDEKNESDMVQTAPDSNIAPATTLSGKNRFYISVVLLIVVILGAGVPLVYDNVAEFISNSFEQSEGIAEVSAVKPAIPPAVKNESFTSPPFPSFREDALRSLLNE